MKYAILISVALIGSVLGVQGVSAHGDEVGEISGELIQIDPMAGENYHLEIKPQTLEGYRIPDMDISVTITNAKTGESSEKHLHSMFGGNFHYGSNVALPEGEYILSFDLEPPTFMREGDRANSWIEPIEAEFTVKTENNPKEGFIIGEKTTKDMKIIFEMETAEPMWEFPEPTAPAPTPVVATTDSDSDGMNKILLGVFALIVGGGLGFFFGKSKRAVAAQ